MNPWEEYAAAASPAQRPPWEEYQATAPAQPSVLDILGGDADAALHGVSQAVVGAPIGAAAQLVAQGLGKSGSTQQAVQDWVNQHLVYQPQSAAGKETVQQFDNLLAPAGRDVQAIDQAIPAPIRPYVEQGARTAGNLLGIAPTVGGVVEGASRIGAANAASDALAAAPIGANDIENALVAAGFRNLPRQLAAHGASAPGLMTRAGVDIVGEPQLASSFRLSNQGVFNNLARNDAGVPIGTELNYSNLAAARADGPGKIYDAAHAALPPQLAQDGELQSSLAKIGDTTSQLPRSPDVQALQQYMLAQPTMSRDQLFANIQQARERASTFYSADQPDSQAMGDAYMGIANAYEDFAGRQLAAVPNAPVTLQQFQNARVQMAKNYAVQDALQGTDVNAAKIAALQRNQPDLLTGGLQLIAEQANRYPLTSGLGSRAFAPGDNVSYGSNPLLRAGGELLAPAGGAALGSVLGGPVGGATGAALGLGTAWAAKKAITGLMTGSPDVAADAAARAATNPLLGNFFGPEGGWPAGSVPFTPGPAGLLEGPTFSAGAQTAPGSPTQLDQMGLTPDVQAAGAAHPGAPRPALPAPEAPLGDLVPAREPGTAPYAPGAPTLPQNWGLSASTPTAPNVGAPQPADYDYAGLLSTGVEPEAPPALALGGAGPLQPPQTSLSGSEADRLSGGLFLAPDELPLGAQPAFTDLAPVMSQGVPEGIVQRTGARSAPTPATNNASGESAASQEAINRSQQEQQAGQVRYRVNPDDTVEPLTGADAVDIGAPPGGLTIQRGVGGDSNGYTILDRGGQPATVAGGQLTRALAKGLPEHPLLAPPVVEDDDLGGFFGGQ